MEQPDEWQFLDTDINWEDLLLEPLELPTVMEDAPLSLGGQASDLPALEDLLAEPHPAPAAQVPATAAGLPHAGSSGKHATGQLPTSSTASQLDHAPIQTEQASEDSSGDLHASSDGGAPTVDTPPLRAEHSGGGDSCPVALQEQLQQADEMVADLQEQLRQAELIKDELARRNSMLEHLTSMQQQDAAAAPPVAPKPPAESTDAKRWWHDEQMKDYLDDCLHLRGPYMLTIRRDAPIYFTREQAAKMPLEEFKALHKEYVNAMAACLMEAGNDADCQVVQRLDRLVLEIGQIKTAIMLDTPDLVQILLQNLHTQQPAAGRIQQRQRPPPLAEGGPPTDKEWDQIVAGMRLSPEQVEAVLSLRELYLRTTAALYRRRRQLATVLQARVPPGTDAGDPMTAVYGAPATCAFSELRDTLREERSAMLLFAMLVWRLVMTPIQYAHVSVTTHPNKPYCTKLADAVGRAAGAPSTAELLAQGAAFEPAVHPALFEAALPPSLRRWWPKPQADLAALYPGLQLDGGPDTPPLTGGAKMQPLNAA